MLAPPNQGSRAADRYTPGWAGSCRHPRAAHDDDATARTLPFPASAEVGVIAASRDAKVSVAESHLDGGA
jgi:hypothetical protein